MKKVTIKEIAKKLDVSVATVSRSINPDTQHLVHKNTLKKVLALIDQESYIPSLAARRLVTGKSYNIAIFFRPEASSLFFDDYYSKMIAGAMNGVRETAYNLHLSVIKDEMGGFDIEKAVMNMDVAGAILCNFMGVFKVSAKNIYNLEVPILIINQYRKEENPNCFLIDNFKSAYEATNYLINKGHKRIGFVRGARRVKDAEDRFLGYRKALEDKGIIYNEKLNYSSDFLEKFGRSAAHYFFGSKMASPSAIFFANDSLAMTTMNELRRMGIRCPEDVSVMGFDGIDAGRYMDPPLTTVRQPIYEMAEEAVREVIRILETKYRFKGTKYFTAKIEERGSVAALYGE